MNFKESKELSHTSGKIYKFVRQNLRTLVRSSLYQKLLFLPLFIGLTYGCLILEVVKYPGFIGNHFIIDAKVYFAVAITLLVFSDTKGKMMNFIFKINRILMVTISLVYLVFSLLEGAYYRNYVLNMFHFHLDGLILPVLFSLSIFLVEKFKHVIPVVKGKLGIVYAGLILLIVGFVVNNAVKVAFMAVSRDSYILFYLKSSYDDKMYYEWGVFYQFMLFVKNNTPAEATIVIPPMQDPWLMGSGNDTFVRAFLFPRKLIQEPLIISDVKDFGPNTYILITWGKEVCKPDPMCHGWPKQDIKATKIIYKDSNSSNVIETRDNTIYKPEDKKYVYGIIEL